MKYIVMLVLTAAIAAGCAQVSQTPAASVQPNDTKRQQMLADQAQAEMESDIQKGFPTLTEPPTKVPAAKAPALGAQPQNNGVKIPAGNVKTIGSLAPVTKYPLKNGYPVWFYNNTYDGYFGAVGIAPKQPDGSIVKQKQVARMQAQMTLAKQIDVLIRSDLTVESVNVGSATVKYYRTKVTSLNKEDADQYLSGFRVQDEWIDPSTGEYYLWMVLEK